jgi:signal transduction histidine kinase
MPEHLQESHWQQFTTFLAERKPGVIVTHGELRGRRKDGSEFPTEGSASMWETSDGVFITSLIRDNTERKRAEDLIKKVDDCLLSFSADPDTNIQRIIEAAGTILDGASASYHKKRGDLLHIAASWNLPAKYLRAPQLSARRFDELCAHYGDGPFVINNPEERRRIPENSPMLQLGFKNFIATPIKLGDTLIGSLNVAYREPKTFSPNELNIFSILAKAISIEEERKKVLEDLKQHQLKLKNSEKSLRAFSGRILSIREEEKKNISSALHDEIGSMVIAISSGLAIAKEDIIENSLDPALKSIDLTETALKQAVDNLKKIAIDLRPPSLDIVGLSNALKNFFLDIARQTNIAIDFSAEVADNKIDDAAAIVLYRTAQEGLNNIVKHAKAKAVSIRLHEKKSNILFEIADNGRGFNPESLTASSRLATKIGIQGMRERIAALGGTLIIESAPQKGTTLHITIPKRKRKKS